MVPVKTFISISENDAMATTVLVVSTWPVEENFILTVISFAALPIILQVYTAQRFVCMRTSVPNRWEQIALTVRFVTKAHASGVFAKIDTWRSENPAATVTTLDVFLWDADENPILTATLFAASPIILFHQPSRLTTKSVFSQ